MEHPTSTSYQFPCCSSLFLLQFEMHIEKIYGHKTIGNYVFSFKTVKKG